MRKARMDSASASSANSTPAGATTMTAGTFRGMRDWVWVSWR